MRSVARGNVVKVERCDARKMMEMHDECGC